MVKNNDKVGGSVLRKTTSPKDPCAVRGERGAGSHEAMTRPREWLRAFPRGCVQVDGSKVSPKSRFKEDLSLDSLDVVEVVMAIEEEFALEIPDAEVRRGTHTRACMHTHLHACRYTHATSWLFKRDDECGLLRVL